jgi:hypothetical protein
VKIYKLISPKIWDVTATRLATKIKFSVTTSFSTKKISVTTNLQIRKKKSVATSFATGQPYLQLDKKLVSVTTPLATEIF